MQSIAVLVADDHAVARRVLKQVVEDASDMRVVGEAENGRLAVELARELEPDVVLMDVVMPELSGLEATRRLCAESPRVRVLAISMKGNRRFVQAMLGVGAAGYLLKDNAAEELADAVRVVAGGGRYLGRGLGEAAL